MQKPTLVILAAGMASRYGSMKQIEGFGPHAETIMDYSIYDAIRCGFGKVVFIIRKAFAQPFKESIEQKLSGRIAVEYVYQEMESYLPAGVTVPEERKKPWGTAHAILCAKDVVNENFVVINADDFYGKEGFAKAYQFCNDACNDQTYGIIGYTLYKTLSTNGTVSRGVCQTDDNNNLLSINERTKIYPKGDEVVYEDESGTHKVDPNSPVSMNFWCFTPNVFRLCEKLFQQFIDKHLHDPKAEFFIPILADHFIREKLGNIKVVPTTAQWFGVTYPQDAPEVKKNIGHLIAEGAYPSNLWNVKLMETNI